MTAIILILLLGFSALFSGLTIGLMGLDIYALRRKVKSGNKDALQGL
jgi:Mg2+/Co2+ transporter CorB